MKNAKPSAVKGRPIMLPLKAMKRGQSRPSSKERTVPETAPMAKRTPKALDQRRARSVQPGSRRHRPSPSAIAMSTGSPTPSTAKTMWKARDVPIVARANVTLSMRWPRGPIVRRGPRSARPAGDGQKTKGTTTAEPRSRRSDPAPGSRRRAVHSSEASQP